MGLFSDSRAQPGSGRLVAKAPRPAACEGRQVPCDKCHVARAQVEVITRAGSVFLCSHHHRMHREAILAAGHRIRVGQLPDAAGLAP
jgi:hypothetical protein